MTYHHGAYVQEIDSSTVTPIKNEAGLHVIFGTAPINKAENPAKAVNQLIVINSFEEAVKKLGYSDDFESYTLCQAVDAYFRVYSVGPIVVCNVLDMQKHKKANEQKEYVVTGKQVKVDIAGIIPDTVVIKIAEENTILENETDYILAFDDAGYLIITLLGGEMEGKTLSVKSDSLAPEMVTETDIIGGIDIETGKESGLELIKRVYPVCGNFPGLLLAPGWSHKKNVAAVMAAKCKEINGVFRCECLIDLDTGIAKKYSECEKLKKENGLNVSGMIDLWPMAAVGGKKYYYSSIYGAMTAQTDADNDSIPTVSPSNKKLHITGAVLKDGAEINLDQPEANTLNSQGIVTILNNQGFRSWGNNMAVYPGIEDTDIKERWINCRRAFTWWGNSFIVTCAEEVDSPANYRLIETIVDKENIRGNSYVQQGKFAGIKMEYLKEDNTKESIMEGRIMVRQYLAPFTPAEFILNVLSFDATLLENALGGNV